MGNAKESTALELQQMAVKDQQDAFKRRARPTDLRVALACKSNWPMPSMMNLMLLSVSPLAVNAGQPDWKLK